VSLRRRLVLAFALIALVLAVADVVIIRTVDGSLYGQIDDRLSNTVGRAFGPPRGAIPQLGQAGQSFSELYIAVWPGAADDLAVISDGVGANQTAPDVSLAAVTAHLPTTTGTVSEPFTVGAVGSSDHWRMVVVRNVDGTITVTGLPLRLTEATSFRLSALTLAASGMVLLVLAIVAWWVIRLGLRPIDDLVRTADEIAAGDMSRRLAPAPVGTEAGHLTEAFNGMVHQIEVAFAERQASEDRLRRFVADASHELRTPLTSIRGYTDLMASGALDEPVARDDALRRIRAESGRMAELVDDLLVLARLDQGRPLEQNPVELTAMVTDAVMDLRAVDPGRPVQLVVPDTPLVVQGDEGRLRQIVANLLTNARVHTPPGTPISVRVAVEDERARLVVADEGAGMSSEVAARVFERFYRADASRRRDRGGSGLGLSIVAAVAEAHGGSAGIDSAPGRGTRVTVELPLG